MAGICYDGTLNEVKKVVIAGTTVTEITRDTAQVGCTKVTRAEAEALLAEMNKIPVIKGFLRPGPEYPDFVGFTLRDKISGWLAASNNPDAEYYGNGGFELKSASFCLRNSHAEELLRFLAEQLNFKVSGAQKFIIEYQTKKNGVPNYNWERS